MLGYSAIRPATKSSHNLCVYDSILYVNKIGPNAKGPLAEAV